MSRNRPCETCGVNPIAYTGRRWCYSCVPRQRRQPWTCRRCGTTENYYAKQLCRRCHRNAPLVDSCRDCLAWGVTRHNKWLCQACKNWRRNYQPAECPSCQRVVPLNHRGFCRLCCRQATLVRPKHKTTDVIALNRNGQQLFFADMILKKRNHRPPPLPPPPAPQWPRAFPVEHRQLTLFDLPRDLVRRRDLGGFVPPIPLLADALERAVNEHAARHGWGTNTRRATLSGMRVVLATQDTPGARVKISETAQLRQCGWFTIQPILDVLAGVGMLEDDRPPPLERLFAAKTTGLPDQITQQVRDWFCALRDGTSTPPRTQPRSTGTVQERLRSVTPALHTWAAAGHTSLREISRDNVIDVLPSDPTQRANVLGSLRSLFRFLKARRHVFANPTVRIRADRVPPPLLLPMDLEPVRAALASTDPAIAAIAAIVAFHAPRNGQLRHLHLTDLVDGRLTIDRTIIVLAEPARQRLASWLAHRTRQWPHTINPHLFINHNTALRTTPVSGPYLSKILGIPVQTIREDRILHEAIATGGDVRRLCDLFGITVSGAERYLASLTHPDLETTAP